MLTKDQSGEHPLVDVIVHQHQVYSDEIDTLIRQIAAHISLPDLRRMYTWYDPPPLGVFKRELQQTLLTLQNDN